MNTNWTRGLSLVGLLLASTATTQANDIVNFLKAINGNSGRRSTPVVVTPVGARNAVPGHVEHGHGPEQGQGFRNGQEHSQRRGHGPAIGGPGFQRPPMNSVDLRPRQSITSRARSGLQVNLRFASNGPSGAGYGYAPPIHIPAQSSVPALPPVPVHPQIAPLPFQLGQFVNCQVPLATCVRVEDQCNIAPNAVPVVIAVRDPNSCVHDIYERLVFVQIFVPPCPLRNLQVSPCRTRMSLDYGKYEVDIKSVNGLVVVDYDN